MNEAEHRFRLASYYRALLSRGIFDDDNSPEAQEVS